MPALVEAVRVADMLRPEQAIRRYTLSNSHAVVDLHYKERAGFALVVYDALRSQPDLERRPHGRAEVEMTEWRLQPAVPATPEPLRDRRGRPLPENTLRARIRAVLRADGAWHLLPDVADAVADAISDEQALRSWKRWRTVEETEPDLIKGRQYLVRERMSDIGAERTLAYRLSDGTVTQ